MKKKYLFIGLIFLLLISCSDYLEREPLDQISTDQYWQSAKDLENYTLQFYPTFPTFRSVSGLLTIEPNADLGVFGWDANRGSDHQIIQTPVDQLNSTRTVVNSGGNWRWTNIRSVNIFFENYRKVKDTPANIQHFIGEAHFFKAWFYFNLVRQYGDVPWYSGSLQVDSPELYNARTPRNEVIDSVLWHLDKAAENLKLLTDADGGNNRLSKEAALILKSRVALFEGSWQKYHTGTPFGTAGSDPAKYFQAAVNAVEELMTPGKYKVGIFNSGAPAEDYNKLFSSTNLASNAEIVLWVKFDRTQTTFSHNFQQTITVKSLADVTMELVKNYLGKDGNPYDYASLAGSAKGTDFLTKISEDCDLRLSHVVWMPGQVMWDNSAKKVLFTKPYLDQSGASRNYTGFQLRKGVDPKDPTAGGAQGYSNSCETGAVIFRYAEALLNYAEAQAELGQAVDYANSLNLLRKRAGMPDFKVIADPERAIYADFGYPLSDELYEIRRERAVELACEGFRFDDWRRWRAHNLFKNKRPKGFPYLISEYAAGLTILTDADGLVDPFQKILPNGYNFNEERDYLDCIPTNEITLNPNVAQNPGW